MKRLGRHHVIRVGTNELCCVGDVTINDTPNVAEAKTRCQVFDKVKPASKSLTISGTVYYDTTKPAFVALRNASRLGTAIAVSVIARSDYDTQSIDETISGTFHVTSWERSEPVEEFVVIDFELRPAVNFPDPQFA